MPAPDNTIVVDVANANRGEFSAENRRDSKTLHHFLVGQLALKDQDFETALRNFSGAAELADQPVPLIHAKLADLYLRFGELDRALQAASAALQEDPSDPSVRLLYAGVLEALGRPVEAEPHYREVIKDFPGKFDAYVLLSHLLVKQQRFDESILILKQLERIDPADSLAHYYLGRTYELMERYPQAEAEYMQVFESDPTLTRGSIELLRVLLRNKKSDRAKALCERMLQKDSSNAVARKVLGHLMLGEAKLDEALQHLLVLEGLEADASDTRFKIALIQMEKRNFDEAARQLNLVLATQPQHSEARYYLASILAGSGKQGDAIKELLVIGRGDPMFVRARTFAAFILRQERDFKEAKRVIAEAREEEPKNKNLLLYYVLILRDLEDYRQAERVMREALKSDPKDERLLFNLGLILHQRGDAPQALEVMEQVIQLNPRNSDALNYLAYGLIERGVDLARAQDLAQRAIEIKPQDPFYLDTLGWAQFKAGKIEQAEVTLQRAVKLAGDDIVIIEHYVEALLSLRRFEQAVGFMKVVVERELSDEEKSDDDTVEAYHRIRNRLESLISERPDLARIEKSQVSKRVNKSSLTGEQGLFSTNIPHPGTL